MKRSRDRWRARACTGACCALLALCAGRAHAYQDPTRFSQAIDMGGGGGRFFTGSPADSYTCKVCHTGGTPPHLSISGLPLNGYVAGRGYRITIDWADDLKAVSLDAEVTDAAGNPFGQLMMPTRSELMDADFCAPVTAGLPDLIVLPVESGQRMVAASVSCGGHQATVDWIAPMPSATATGGAATAAHFNGSLVASNADGTVAGDNVTDFSRVIEPVGEAVPAATHVAGGCRVAPANTRAAKPAFVLIACALALRRRRRAATAQHGEHGRR